LSGIVSSPIIIMTLLCFAQIGVSSVPIAAINSLGNLSGFAGPYAMGYLKDLTGNFTAGLLMLAGCALLGAIVAVSLRIDVKREQSLGKVALAH
jgi:cyanate permease